MSNTNMLTKQAILGATDFEVKQVEVPEWNGSVRLKTLSGKERDSFEAKVASQSKGDNNIDLRGIRAFLLAMCLVDQDNVLVFGEKDIEALNKKSSKVINDLFEVAQSMNGIGEEAVKELVKN